MEPSRYIINRLGYPVVVFRVVIADLNDIIYEEFEHAKWIIRAFDVECVFAVLELYRAFNIKVNRIGQVEIDCDAIYI